MATSEAEGGRLTIRFWITAVILTVVLTAISMWWVLFQSGQCLLSLSLLAALTYYMPLVFIYVLYDAYFPDQKV